jgi:hypothetical protein
MSEQRWSPYVEAKMLQDMYKTNPRQHSFHLLLLGDKGHGKTSLLQTARKPVHIDSFDKGGSKVLNEMKDKGLVFVDDRYEIEDPLEPTAFEQWKRNFETRRLRRYYDHLGTYCIDSSTSWQEAVMNWCLKNAKSDDGRGNRCGQNPRWKEYVIQKVQMTTYIEWILNLPCDVVLTGHLRPDYEKTVDGEGEEISNFIGYKYAATGQNYYLVPAKFDEVYIAMRTPGTKGDKFTLLTGKEKWYNASSRIDNGKFSKYEEPDIKYLLKKIGWDTKDKPSLLTPPEEQDAAS